MMSLNEDQVLFLSINGSRLASLKLAEIKIGSKKMQNPRKAKQ
jgi:hypothetical protein